MRLFFLLFMEKIMKVKAFNPLIITHLFSVLTGFIVIISLMSILEPLIVVLWSCLTITGIIAILKNRSEILSPVLRFILALTLVIFVIILNIEKNWQIVLAFILVVLLGVKSLELKKQRDVFQITGLAVLGIGVASFLRFDLIIGVYLLLILVLSIILMLWQHIVDSVEAKFFNEKKWFYLFVKFSFLTSLIICILILPLSFFFFFLLPRSFTPLFKGQSGFNVVKTGFSSKMSPGQLSEIILSDDVAFRAKIEPQPENSKNLYWIGAILWGTDGIDWYPDPPDNPDFIPFSLKNIPVNSLISQTITMPAKDESYLFSLWHPVRVELLKGVQYFRDGTLKLSYPINIPVRYTVYSSEQFNQLNITPNERKSGLIIPPNIHENIKKLAGEIRGESADDLEIAQKIQIYLKKPPFKYSLKSPPGYASGQNLSDFLLETKTGYCELYASAMTILLRLSGVPARVAVGYKGAEYNPMGEYWLVREKFAHAWTQAYIKDKGWINFDPTPSGLFGDSQIIDPYLINLQQSSQEISETRRIWDWLQWQWANVIIDLTPEKQMLIWRETGLKIGKIFQRDFKEWNVSFEKVRINIKNIIVFLFFLAIAGILIYFFKKRNEFFSIKSTSADAKLRKKAILRLMAGTPVKGKFFKPGQEIIYLKWWKDNKPEHYYKICDLYYLQRYGERPTTEKDKELQEIISSS